MSFKKIIAVSLSLAHILTISLPSAAFAAEFSVFEETYVRDNGMPDTVEDTFSVLNPDTDWTLRAVNGSLEDDEVKKISSLTMTLNGEKVLRPKQFNQNVDLVESPVSVSSLNTVAMQLRSKPGGQLSVSIVGQDNNPPMAQWTAPQADALFNNSNVSARLDLSDDISGLDPQSLQMSLDGTDIKADFSPFTQATLAATLQADLTVDEGEHTLSVQVDDLAGQSANAAVSFTVDLTPPVIDNVQPADDSLLANATPILSAQFSDNLSGVDEENIQILLDGNDVTTQADASATGFQFTPAALTDGSHALSINISDNAGNASQVEVNFVTDTSPPVIFNLVPESGSVLDTATPDISGEFSDDTSGIDVNSIQILLNGADITAESNVTTGGFDFVPSAELDNTSHNLTVTVADIAGNQAQETVSFTVSLEPDDSDLPPDPQDVAPEIDATVATTVAAASAFLYTGSDPIQTGVDEGTIEPRRTAVLRGKVLERDDTSLSGVTITILNHPEFGQTLSRADGMFDMAVNGGGVLTVYYQKEGYLSVQRTVNVPWQDYVPLPDVVMIPLDEEVSTVDLTAGTMQVAQGSVETDDDGTRQATILLPSGNKYSNGHARRQQSISYKYGRAGDGIYCRG